MKKFTYLLVCIITVTSAMLNAQTEQWVEKVKNNPDNIDVLLEAGIACHDLANSCSGKAANLSEKYLGTLLDEQPRHGLAMVYYGSLMSINARDVGAPWEKMEFMDKAFSKMDKAVLLYPDNMHIRLVRGVNHCYLPEMFNRLDIALEDLNHIESLVSAGTQPMDNRSMVSWMYHYGMALQAKGNTKKAAHYYKKVAEIAPDSPLGKQSAAELKAIGE